MKLKKILAGQLLVLALVFPATVSAEDFTINGSLELSKLHRSVTKVELKCSVSYGFSSADTGYLLIGTGTYQINVPPNGEINTPVQIKINADSGKDPAVANRYGCNIYFYGGGPIFEGAELPNPPMSDHLPECTAPNNIWKCVRAPHGLFEGGDIP
jgi:hypothetical protein